MRQQNPILDSFQESEVNNPFNPIMSTLRATNWRVAGFAAAFGSAQFAAGSAAVGAIVGRKNHKVSAMGRGALYGGAAGAVGAAGFSVWAQRALRAAA
jgi:hypothetical protein